MEHGAIHKHTGKEANQGVMGQEEGDLKTELPQRKTLRPTSIMKTTFP